MWLANFEDGSSVTSKSCFWTQLREKGKKLTGIQLSHPHFQNLYLNLSDLDRYYFVTEAIAFLQAEGNQSSSQVVAEIIGGHNMILGVGIEIRLDYKGSVKSRIYKLDKYRYAADILVDGVREG
jgi:hypothetical protein